MTKLAPRIPREVLTAKREKRKPITYKEKIASLIHWGTPICPFCSNIINEREVIEFAHLLADYFGGTAEPHNLRPAHKFCHRARTAHPRGKHTSVDSDQHSISKAKRLERERLHGKRPSKRPLPKGRGFDKTFTKHLDGSVERRR